MSAQHTHPRVTAGRVLGGTARFGGRTVAGGLRALPPIEPGGARKVIAALLGVGVWFTLWARWGPLVPTVTILAAMCTVWSWVDRRIRARRARRRSGLSHPDALAKIHLLERCVILLLVISAKHVDPLDMDGELRAVDRDDRSGGYGQPSREIRRAMAGVSAHPDADPVLYAWALDVRSAERLFEQAGPANAGWRWRRQDDSA